MTTTTVDRLTWAIGLLLGSLILLGTISRCVDPEPAYAWIDPIVAADHAAPDLTLPMVVVLAEPTWIERAWDRADPLLPVGTGFLLLLGFARPLAYARRRWSRWRRGWFGNAAATAYAAATVAAGALVIGSGYYGAAVALGTVVAGGRLLASDPETARIPPAPTEVVPS